jgi:hypothetical protein
MGELIEADIRLLRTKLDLPLVVYLSAVTPLEILAEIGNLASVDALAIAGPIPLGYRGFNWKSLGISDGDADRPSWLEQPGLVGPACLPFAVDRLHQLRDQGFNLPIIVGNGIMSPADVDHLKHVRGSAVMLGRDIAQDPRAVSGTIKAANRELPATMARMMQAVAPAAPHPR